MKLLFVVWKRIGLLQRFNKSLTYLKSGVNNLASKGYYQMSE